MGWFRSPTWLVFPLVVLAHPSFRLEPAPAWLLPLRQDIAAIDARTEGDLGVYVKLTGMRGSLKHNSGRLWYLASTIKVPVAIALLQQVEAGALSLDDELVLHERDFVDGAGDLRWQKPGTRVRIASLLEKMLVHSDSTATDMLIRKLGENALNRHIRERLADEEFGPITTILQVRYDAYAELHSNVTSLSNLDFVRLKGAHFPDERLQALLAMLDVTSATLKAHSIPEAFERYYESGKNSATLESYGRMLERLNDGALLNPFHTQLLLNHMETMVTGENRIKAGLPRHFRFAQKTGTQVRRICNMGIIHAGETPHVAGDRAIVVTACMERFSSQTAAERALAAVGEAIAARINADTFGDRHAAPPLTEVDHGTAAPSASRGGSANSVKERSARWPPTSRRNAIN